MCGGTGLYIESILLDYPLNDIEPNYELRKKLETKSINSLLKLAGEQFIKNSNESELNNRRRIIRFIEKLNQPKRKQKQVIKIDNPLIIGTNFARAIIREKIEKRLIKRLNEGLVEEVKGLLNNGISSNRLESIGLEYKFVSQYLDKIYTKDEFILKKLSTENRELYGSVKPTEISKILKIFENIEIKPSMIRPTKEIVISIPS